MGTVEGRTPQMHEQPVLMVRSAQQQLSGSPSPPEQHICSLDLLSAPARAKPRHGSWLLGPPALPRPLSRQVPCHLSGLSAPQRVRGTRQPRSIFRLWRIPLGSPFRAEKVSHCEGEAKTRIRPTDPALTRAHRSELAGLQHFGGREVAAGAGREAAKGTASRSKTQRCALLAGLGYTSPAPGRKAAPWVCLPHQCHMGQRITGEPLVPKEPPILSFLLLTGSDLPETSWAMHSSLQPGHFCLETPTKVEGRAGSHLPGLQGQLLIRTCPWPWWGAGMPGKAEQWPCSLRGAGARELEDKVPYTFVVLNETD